MKIISQGSHPAQLKYRCTCRKCGTVFEFEKQEALYMTDQRDGDYLLINCPTCSATAYVDVTLGVPA